MSPSLRVAAGSGCYVSSQEAACSIVASRTSASSFEAALSTGVWPDRGALVADGRSLCTSFGSGDPGVGNVLSEAWPTAAGSAVEPPRKKRCVLSRTSRTRRDARAGPARRGRSRWRVPGAPRVRLLPFHQLLQPFGRSVGRVSVHRRLAYIRRLGDLADNLSMGPCTATGQRIRSPRPEGRPSAS